MIDHSVQVDVFGNVTALERNAEIEFARNRERYEFLRWGQKAFRNFRVVPPATGIVHQVNLEYLARGVMTAPDPDGGEAMFPDTLVGTDSHTTMINGLGVVGWGVGGIEAEAVMLGQPFYMVMPGVVGMKLSGSCRRRDRDRPRAHGDPDAAQEGRGRRVRRVLRAGLSAMPVADRATIAQHGARVRRDHGFLPGRPRDAGLSRAHRARPTRRACSSATPRSRDSSVPTPRPIPSSPTRSSSTGHGRAEPGGAQAPAGSRDAPRHEERVPPVAGGAGQGARFRPGGARGRRSPRRWRRTAIAPRSATAPW